MPGRHYLCHPNTRGCLGSELEFVSREGMGGVGWAQVSTDLSIVHTLSPEAWLALPLPTHPKSPLPAASAPLSRAKLSLPGLNTDACAAGAP